MIVVSYTLCDCNLLIKFFDNYVRVFRVLHYVPHTEIPSERC